MHTRGNDRSSRSPAVKIFKELSREKWKGCLCRLALAFPQCPRSLLTLHIGHELIYREGVGSPPRPTYTGYNLPLYATLCNNFCNKNHNSLWLRLR